MGRSPRPRRRFAPFRRERSRSSVCGASRRCTRGCTPTSPLATRMRASDRKTLQKQITDLRTRAIPAAARAFLAQLQSRERALNGQIAATSEEIRTIPTRAIEEQRLRREQAMYEGMYTNLSARYADARL